MAGGVYPILQAGVRDEGRAGVCALAVMAKAPRAGKVKTRLAPALGFDGSAAINTCFLKDTTRNIADVCAPGGAAGLVCYTPIGDEVAFDGLLPDGFELVAQRGDAFGERLLAAAEDILSLGFGAVCLIDSDSPTIPQSALRMAVEQLAKPGDRVVLGGSDDGGYYLIGLKRAHREPFENITWSTASVFTETVLQCERAALELVQLPVWYDVDDAETLAVLERELLDGKRPSFAHVDGYDATATREFLKQRIARQGLVRGTSHIDWIANWHQAKPWMTNVALSLVGCGLLALTRQFVVETHHFSIGFSGVSGWSAWLYLAAIAIVLTQPVNRATLWIVLGFAVVMRAIMIWSDPFLSTDIYRYVWDGLVQHAGVNPYRYVPGDAALAAMRGPHEDLFENINRRDYAHTIYPPVAQMIYYCVTFVAHHTRGMKIAMFGFECVSVSALIALLKTMGRRTTDVLLYTWCPLLVWEIGNAGHVDAVVIAFVALALLARARGSKVGVGAALGAAFLTKFYPLVLFPALWRRKDWKMPVVMIAMTLASYAMYSSVGKMVFGFASEYAREEGMNTGARYFLLDWVRQYAPSVTLKMFDAFCVVVMGALCVWAWKKATVGTDFAWLKITMCFAFALMLLFAPHYPWYVIWLVPFVVLVPNWPVLAYLMTFFYMFSTDLADGTPKNMIKLNEVLYGAVIVACGLQWAWSRWDVKRHFVANAAIENS